jgi:hypothetical protein
MCKKYFLFGILKSPFHKALAFSRRRRSPSIIYLFAAGVEAVYFRLITLRHTPKSVGLLWTRDQPVAETST